MNGYAWWVRIASRSCSTPIGLNMFAYIKVDLYGLFIIGLLDSGSEIEWSYVCQVMTIFFLVIRPILVISYLTCQVLLKIFYIFISMNIGWFLSKVIFKLSPLKP